MCYEVCAVCICLDYADSARGAYYLYYAGHNWLARSDALKNLTMRKFNWTVLVPKTVALLANSCDCDWLIL